MDELIFDTEQTEEELFEIEPAYNKHYIIVDDQGRVTDGWSDGPHLERSADGATLLTDQGGYQFRLYPMVGAVMQRTEENPPIYDFSGMVPLYKWDGFQVLARTQEEIEADRATFVSIDDVRAAKEAEISAACNAAILAGMDVETSVGTEHFSLQETDQINLTTATNAVQTGAAGYPYHADGSLCRMFSAEEIMAIAQASINHKLYHTTLCNHLLTWARRAETVEEIQGITYSAEGLPEDLAENMAGIFTAAAAEM